MFEITFDSNEPMEAQFRSGVGGAVTSVNGQTGDVVLNAGDIGYSDAATYSSGSVGAEVSDLKSALVKTPQTITWTIGGLNDNGTEAESTSRLRSNYIRVFNGSVIRISNTSYANGIYSMVLAFDTAKVMTGQLLANTMISVGNSLTIKADFDGYVRIRHYYRYDPTITDALFDLASTMYTVYTNEADLATQYHIDAIEADYDYNRIAYSATPTWELGSLNDNGSVGTSTSRIVSSYIPFFSGARIVVEPHYANGIYVVIVLYELLSDNSYRKIGIIDRTLYADGTTTTLTIPYDCYARIGAYYRYDPTLTNDSKAALIGMITSMISPILKGFEGRIVTIERLLPYDVDADFIIENRDLQNNSTIMFAWASDTHHQVHGVATSGVSTKLLKEFAEVAEAIKTDFLTITGDIVNGYYPVDEQKENLIDVVNTIRCNCSMPVLFAEGNHDDNSWYASASGSSGSEYTGLAEVLNNDQFTSYVMNNSIEDVVFNNADPLGGYYYKDFKKSKIRVIVLNVEDIPYIENEDLSLDYYGQWTMGFQQNQLEWLANNALVFNESGWGVVFLMHNDSNMTGNTQVTKNISNLNDIVNAFISKDSGTTSSTETDFELSVSYNFADNASNEVIAWFSGHIHQDSTELIDGIPHVTITNTFNATGGGYDIVTVDRNEKKIYTKRYNGEPLTTYNRTISY